MCILGLSGYLKLSKREIWCPQHILNGEIPLGSKFIYSGYIPTEWMKRDKYLMNTLLVARKKTHKGVGDRLNFVKSLMCLW